MDQDVSENASSPSSTEATATTTASSTTTTAEELDGFQVLDADALEAHARQIMEMVSSDAEATPEMFLEQHDEIMCNDNNVVEKDKKEKKKKQQGFRKAPNAPKRFKSPYILFSMHKMKEYKREPGVTKVTRYSARISEEWKALSEKERQQWGDAARQDKIRYDAEKILYTGPWQVPSKRPRKDPSAPKRPPSAFLFYCKTHRPKLKAENPTMKNTEISVLLGEQWKNAPEHIRRPHVEREQRERDQYKIKIAEWRKQKEHEERAIKKQRQVVTEEFIKAHGYDQQKPPWTSPATATTSAVATASAAGYTSTSTQNLLTPMSLSFPLAQAGTARAQYPQQVFQQGVGGFPPQDAVDCDADIVTNEQP